MNVAAPHPRDVAILELQSLRRIGNSLGFIACAFLIGCALYFEHVLGLEPCPLCIFQRVAVFATGILFLVGALHAPAGRAAWVYGSLTATTALAGVCIAARHIWIQAQPPGTVPSCGASLDYLIEVMLLREVIATVLSGSGECAKVDWTFASLSMPWWVAISLGCLALWALAINFKSSPWLEGEGPLEE